jgi:hypothetical protein
VLLPTAPTATFALLWRHGDGDDHGELAGLARILLACRLQRARAAVPGVTASGGDVDDDTSLAWVVADRTAADAALRFVQVLADDAAPLGEDALALALARAALAADDEAFVLPGTVLMARLRAHWFAGHDAKPTPPADPARAMSALSVARVRELLLVPRPRLVGVLGGCTVAQVAAARAFFTTADAAAFVRSPVLPSGGPRALVAEAHARVDAPFVATAFPIADEPRPVLAVAVALARQRAERRWQPRSIEAVARAPFVAWSWLHDEPLVVFHRRGFAARKLLPGERAALAEAETAATRAEIEALLADLQQHAPTPAELQAAKAAMATEYALDREPIAAGEARAASVWLPARLRASVRGIEPATLSRVTAAEVHALWQRRFAPLAGGWHALAPVSRAGFGFLPR